MLYTVSELGNVTFLTILNWFRLGEPTSAYFQVPWISDAIPFRSEKFDLKKPLQGATKLPIPCK